MKLTREDLTNIIKQEIKQVLLERYQGPSIFDIQTGKVSERGLDALYGKLVKGQPNAAAEQLWTIAPAIHEQGHKFNIVHGIENTRDEIAKYYSLNPQTGKAQGPAPAQNVAQIQNYFQQQADLIDKQAQQFAKQQEDQLQQMMDKFKSEQEARQKAIELEKTLTKQEQTSYYQARGKFEELERQDVLDNVRQQWNEWMDDRKEAGNQYDNSEKKTEDYLTLLRQRDFINKKWLNILDKVIKSTTKQGEAQ